MIFAGVARDPGTSRTEAGLPPKPTLASTVQSGTVQPSTGEGQWVVTTRPEETEVTEDIYEQ